MKNKFFDEKKKKYMKTVNSIFYSELALLTLDVTSMIRIFQ